MSRLGDVGPRAYDFGDDDAPLPSDARFDAWIARRAPGINVPPATPRADMWDAIVAARESRPPAHGGTLIAVARRRWHVPAAIAAALLVGIALERFVLPHDAPRTTVADVGHRVPRSAPLAPAPEPDTIRGAASVSPQQTSGQARELAVAPPFRVPGGTARIDAAVRAARTPTADADTARPDADAARPDADAARAARLYRLAAEQTFTQAEALLTAYRAGNLAAHDSVAARQFGRWGRDVLSSTRLLLDSPAGADPQLRALLDDLELVLVQIVRLSGTPLDASDRAVIDRAMHGSDLLPRLRTAVPSGAASTSSDE